MVGLGGEFLFDLIWLVVVLICMSGTVIFGGFSSIDLIYFALIWL